MKNVFRTIKVKKANLILAIEGMVFRLGFILG